VDGWADAWEGGRAGCPAKPGEAGAPADNNTATEKTLKIFPGSLRSALAANIAAVRSLNRPSLDRNARALRAALSGGAR